MASWGQRGQLSQQVIGADEVVAAVPAGANEPAARQAARWSGGFAGQLLNEGQTAVRISPDTGPVTVTHGGRGVRPKRLPQRHAALDYPQCTEALARAAGDGRMDS